MRVPMKIEPAAVYDNAALRLAPFSAATLARARQSGRLRFARQGHRVIYRGQWLIDWLESEAKAETQSAPAGGATP
jgi:hypothetical protein